MPYDWKIELDSVDITAKVSRWDITIDAEQFCRELVIDFADPSDVQELDFTQLPTDPAIEVFTKVDAAFVSQGTYFIERPALATDLDRQISNGVWGRSKIAKLALPYCDRISKTWESDTKFFDICQEMCDLAGLTWDENYSEIADFTVYAYTYQMENGYPVDVIGELAELADGYLSTDAADHVCIRKIDYSPSSSDHDLTDIDLQSVAEYPQWPPFGNRVRVTPADSLAGYALALSIPRQCLPADGSARARILARVTDADGNPVDNQPVEWSSDAGDATLDSSVTVTATVSITETIQASSFSRLSVSLPPDSVDGVYAKSDASRRSNLAASGYSLDGTEIILNNTLRYCDQALTVVYRSTGVAINWLTAGTTAEDVKITASVDGQQASEYAYIGNSCQCPDTITVSAAPSSIDKNEVSKILVYAENSGGPITDGRLVFLSEPASPKRGSLSWEAARLGTVGIANESASAENTVSGASSVTMARFPAAVSSVYQADANGQPTGSNLYASHSGKTVALNTTLATGTALLINYTAQGAALASFTGEIVGTAQINAYMATTTEAPAEASTSVLIGDPLSELPDYVPPGWTPTTEDDGNDSTGPDADPAPPGGDAFDPTTGNTEDYDDSAAAKCGGTDQVCSDGKVCCEKNNVPGCYERTECDESLASVQCASLELASDPTLEAHDRFAAALASGCECQTICDAEFAANGTTKSYDDGSMRTIGQIVSQDYGLYFVSGGDNAAYWAKYAELKAAAIEACLDDCDLCRTAAVPYSDDMSEALNQGDVEAFSISGGVGPFSYSLSLNGTSHGFSLQVEGESESRSNVLTVASDAAGGGTVTVTDSCGNTGNLEFRCVDDGQWVEMFRSDSDCCGWGISGPPDAYGSWTGGRYADIISGGKMVRSYYRQTHTLDCTDCEGPCPESEADPANNPCGVTTTVGTLGYDISGIGGNNGDAIPACWCDGGCDRYGIISCECTVYSGGTYWDLRPACYEWRPS